MNDFMIRRIGEGVKFSALELDLFDEDDDDEIFSSLTFEDDVVALFSLLFCPRPVANTDSLLFIRFKMKRCKINAKKS